MMQPNELGDTFVSRKVLESMGIDVPEDTLGFFTRGNTLCLEVMDTGDGAGQLMIMVDTVELPLNDEQVAKLKSLGFYSEKGFRLGA